jgi:hypothetical protein
VSFLTADSDPGQYGNMRSFTMPQGQTIEGPLQVNNAIIRTPAVSTAITLLNQQGSQILQGSMEMIPIGNTLLYVRPFYAQGRGSGSYPLFQFMVVYNQNSGAFCGPTVEDALDQMLGRKDTVNACNVSTVPLGTGAGQGSTTTTTTTPPTTTVPGAATTAPTTTTIPQAAGSTQELLAEAATDLDNAQKALEAGNLGEYQRLVEDARTKVKQAQAKQQPGG